MENSTEMSMTVIPYFVHEGVMVRLERANRRIAIALIIAIVLMCISNAAWLYCWMQYDYVGDSTEIVTTVDSEGDGIANYTGNDGGVIIGESDGTQNNEDTRTD